MPGRSRWCPAQCDGGLFLACVLVCWCVDVCVLQAYSPSRWQLCGGHGDRFASRIPWLRSVSCKIECFWDRECHIIENYTRSRRYAGSTVLLFKMYSFMLMSVRSSSSNTSTRSLCVICLYGPWSNVFFGRIVTDYHCVLVHRCWLVVLLNTDFVLHYLHFVTNSFWGRFDPTQYLCEAELGQTLFFRLKPCMSSFDKSVSFVCVALCESVTLWGVLTFWTNTSLWPTHFAWSAWWWSALPNVIFIQDLSVFTKPFWWLACLQQYYLFSVWFCYFTIHAGPPAG